MQIVRTIIWVLILFGLLAFSFFNWNPVEVRIWTNTVLETKVPALVIISFLLGLLPMWLVHRTSRWGMKRRINALENAARTTAASEPAAPVPAPEPAPIRPETTTDDLAAAREKKDADPL